MTITQYSLYTFNLRNNPKRIQIISEKYDECKQIKKKQQSNRKSSIRLKKIQIDTTY